MWCSACWLRLCASRSSRSEQVERLRAQLLTGLAMRAQDTGEMAGLAFDQMVYAGHPYSRPDDGYPETIQAIQREDLVNFHRSHYGPRGMTIAIVGGISAGKGRRAGPKIPGRLAQSTAAGYRAAATAGTLVR